MRHRKKIRVIETYGLSFLDCLCCGFGAIILLFVLTKFSKLRYARTSPTAPVEESRIADDQSQLLETQLRELRHERRRLDDQMVSRRSELTQTVYDLENEQTSLASLQSQIIDRVTDSDVQRRIGSQLAAARQRLSDEMKLLLKSLPKPKNKIVGGIPVDSDYVVFIIDTSGSMRRHWPLVRRKMEETLEIYPKIKGMQIMNDMGQYMFSQYKGRWIPDTPRRRQMILQLFDTWVPFSNSSPVEGIETAISKFYSQEHKISLYVFGDDFQGFGMESVIKTVDRLNRKDNKGGRRVRIHAVGFPGQLLTPSGKQFSTLMRVLCDRNAGTFVGIASP